MTTDSSLINTILSQGTYATTGRTGRVVEPITVNGVTEYHIVYNDALWIVVVGPDFASALPTH